MESGVLCVLSAGEGQRMNESINRSKQELPARLETVLWAGSREDRCVCLVLRLAELPSSLLNGTS